ncbi:hypothetical protein PIROE2DRAFT_16383 [Piromyces sp. E2]|nr:hypothetical protein PIROE2DRAFT_16383 [Piromyces sp. E2]|eukprot:OUM58357.1 hypothetical protein PIROE2DRAFT_16383 [Piromyces sp. E2]
MSNNTEIRNNKRGKAALILNIIIFIFEFIALFLCYQHGGFRNVKYYTVLSNVFTMVTCACYIVYYFKSKGKEEMPYWIKIIRYMGTNCLALTFIVVMTVLVPMVIPYEDGVYKLLVEGPQLFHHIFCPILSVISFGLLEENNPNYRDAFIAVIPTLIYAVVLIILNFARVVDGPYPFLKVYDQSVLASIFWFIAIVGAAFLLAYLIKLLTKYKNRKYNNDNATETAEMV